MWPRGEGDAVPVPKYSCGPVRPWLIGRRDGLQTLNTWVRSARRAQVLAHGEVGSQWGPLQPLRAGAEARAHRLGSSRLRALHMPHQAMAWKSQVPRWSTYWSPQHMPSGF